MKRTLFGLALATVILGIAISLLLPGCKPRANSGGGANTESDNVLWRNELFNYAIDTLLNRTDEFYSAERQQQTINRLDQWVRLQKPLQDWKPDPVIAGVTEDLQAARNQVLDLTKRITSLQQGDNTVPLDDMPGEFRSAGERLGSAGVRLGLLDIIQMGSQMVAMADQTEKVIGENAATPDRKAEALRALFAPLSVEQFRNFGDRYLSSLARRIDPSILEFPAMDGVAFQEAVWLRNVASWAGGEELDDPVKPAVALFDWVIRNVQLVREPGTDDSNSLTHVFQTPMETLLFGQGTGIDRAWLFVLLARQKNIDAAILGLVDENGVVNRLWGVGVLIEGEIYLFEPVLGLPIPKPGSQKLTENGLTVEPATLTEAAANEAVCKQLDMFEEGDYAVRSKDLQQVVVLVEASPTCLSQRMKMVEKHLTGDQKIVLTSDVTAQIERFKKCKHVVDGQMWSLAYQTIWQEIRFGPERMKWLGTMIATLVYPPESPILWKARNYHFKGQFTGNPSATKFYLEARQSDFVTNSAAITAQEKEMWRQMKIDASYWLGLMAAQTGNHRAAEDYLKTRVLMADPGGKWEQGATYNMARVAEATGNIPLAIDLLELHPNVPQVQGNVIRAAWLRKLTGQPPLKPRSDNDSKQPEPKKPDDSPEGKTPGQGMDSKPGDEKPAPESKVEETTPEKSEPAPQEPVEASPAAPTSPTERDSSKR